MCECKRKFHNALQTIPLHIFALSGLDSISHFSETLEHRYVEFPSFSNVSRFVEHAAGRFTEKGKIDGGKELRSVGLPLCGGVSIGSRVNFETRYD